MAAHPIETIEFEMLVDGRLLPCLVQVFDDGSARLVTDGAEWTFQIAPDCREQALFRPEVLTDVRISLRPAG